MKYVDMSLLPIQFVRSYRTSPTLCVLSLRLIYAHTKYSSKSNKTPRESVTARKDTMKRGTNRKARYATCDIIPNRVRTNSNAYRRTLLLNRVVHVHVVL
jgi:hypothetical protein